MKYALLVYEQREPPSEPNRALHDRHAYERLEGGSARMIAHYRMRSPDRTTTIRLSESNVTRARGPAGDHGTLRAVFLIESDEEESVLEIAGQVPAVRLGGTVEVWPLIEPARGHDDRRQAVS